MSNTTNLNKTENITIGIFFYMMSTIEVFMA